MAARATQSGFPGELPYGHHPEAWGLIVLGVIVAITALAVLTALVLWIKYLIDNRR